MTQTRRGFLRRAAVAGSAGVVGPAVASGGATAAQFGLGEVVHTTVSLNVRDGPGTGNAVLDTEPPAMRGTVKDGPVSADGFEWYFVEFDDDRYEGGQTGWSATDGTWLAPGKEFTSKFCIYDGVHATDFVNIRDGPGTGNVDVGTASPGDTGTVVAGPTDSDGFTWWNVEFHDNTDGWVAQNWLAEGFRFGCDGAWHTADDEWALAKIITSEAGRFVASDAARKAVGYSVLNRMARNGTDAVTDEWSAYAHSRDPSAESLDLADRILRCVATDTSAGATHFYSPQSMPMEGEDTTGFNVGGGLEWTPGLSQRNYCPDWSETFVRTYVPGAVQANYKFYRKQGDGAVF